MTGRGIPPSCCVSFHSNATGRGAAPSRRVSFYSNATGRVIPFLLCFFSLERDGRGYSPFPSRFCPFQRDRKGIPFLSCFFSLKCDGERSSPSRCVSLQQEGVFSLCTFTFLYIINTFYTISICIGSIMLKIHMFPTY